MGEGALATRSARRGVRRDRGSSRSSARAQHRARARRATRRHGLGRLDGRSLPHRSARRERRSPCARAPQDPHGLGPGYVDARPGRSLRDAVGRHGRRRPAPPRAGRALVRALRQRPRRPDELERRLRDDDARRDGRHALGRNALGRSQRVRPREAVARSASSRRRRIRRRSDTTTSPRSSRAKRGTLWVGTDGGGLASIDKDGRRRLAREAGHDRRRPRQPERRLAARGRRRIAVDRDAARPVALRAGLGPLPQLRAGRRAAEQRVQPRRRVARARTGCTSGRREACSSSGPARRSSSPRSRRRRSPTSAPSPDRCPSLRRRGRPKRSRCRTARRSCSRSACSISARRTGSPTGSRGRASRGRSWARAGRSRSPTSPRGATR